MTTTEAEDTDHLGRCCFDSKDSRRKRPTTRFIRRSFVNREMSVDYEPEMNIKYLTVLHSREGKQRPQQQTFYGWYVFGTNCVNSGGGDIVPDETNENPWHCNVVAPDSPEQSDELLHFYEKIAAHSRWVEQSDSQSELSPSVEEFLRGILK